MDERLITIRRRRWSGIGTSRGLAGRTVVALVAVVSAHDGHDGGDGRIALHPRWTIQSQTMTRILCTLSSSVVGPVSLGVPCVVLSGTLLRARVRALGLAPAEAHVVAAAPVAVRVGAGFSRSLGLQDAPVASFALPHALCAAVQFWPLMGASWVGEGRRGAGCRSQRVRVVGWLRRCSTHRRTFRRGWRWMRGGVFQTATK